jgi:hypothetical protein
MSGRTARAIADDETRGPAALERLLATVTVALLVVMVLATVGHGVLTFVGGVSGRLAGQ